MNTQTKGEQLQNIDLVEGMTLICTKEASYRPAIHPELYAVGREYKVVSVNSSEKILGIKAEDSLLQVWTTALFTIKEQQPLSFANTKIDLRDANGNVDEAKSIAFQEAAFKEGCHWSNSGATLQFTDEPFLFIDKQDSTLSYVNHNQYEFFLYASDEFTEITFEYEHKLEYKIALKESNKLSEKEVKLNKVISDLEEQLAKAKKALEGV